jgi:hypothetical protein
MHPSSFIRTLVLCAPFVSNAFAQSDISDPTKRAEYALSSLQIWYNVGTGLWSTTGWWNSANIVTIVANLAKVDDSPQLQNLYDGCRYLWSLSLT